MSTIKTSDPVMDLLLQLSDQNNELNTSDDFEKIDSTIAKLLEYAGKGDVEQSMMTETAFLELVPVNSYFH